MSSEVPAEDVPPVASRKSGLSRLLRRAVKVVAVLVVLPFVLLPLYAVVDPPLTTVMIEKRLGGASIQKTWTDLDDISPNIVRAVMMAEDARFCEHSGMDFVEMQKALEKAQDGGRLRGASTITMQMVKNLFLWTGRDWIRKGMEAPLALYADLVLSKRRIMEIYLNIVEWDTGVYGAGAAAEQFFGVPPSRVSLSQAARMAAVLPAPEARNPAKPGPQTARTARSIAGRAQRAGPYDDCLLD
jgi:monofunctional biosynthetic peptidoglycan transglycosylase